MSFEESKWNSIILNLNSSGIVSLLSVDEVHSIALDKSFRDDLLKLKEDFFRPLLRKRSYLRVLAMTGTATNHLLEEIEHVLNLVYI